MIDLLDSIIKIRLNGKKDALYKCYCDSCGLERGYFAKNLANRNCNSCAAKLKMSTLSLQVKIMRSKKAQSCRKNTAISQQTREKISKANTGKTHTLERRIKASALRQGLSIDDWSDFEYNKEDVKRSKYKSEKFCLKVYEHYDFTCVKCNKRGGRLHAHHLNNWKEHVDQRYDMENIVCLCVECHRLFHSIYGTRNNTKQQFEEFKEISYV